jgi:uncharacterized membrane protein
MSPVHPLLVHLPIALILLWPIVDGLGLWLKRSDVSRVGVALLGLAFIASLAAMVSGQQSFDAAVAQHVDPQLLNTHADKAAPLPWVLLAVLFARTFGVLKLKRRAHVASIVVGALLWPWIWVVGSSGGDLVFGHAIGVHVEVGQPTR